MLFVTSTTMTAAVTMVTGRFAQMIEDGRRMIDAGNAAGHKVLLTGYLNAGLTVFVVSCVAVLLLWAVARWVAVLGGFVPPKPQTSS
jgi:hypothetical protein